MDSQQKSRGGLVLVTIIQFVEGLLDRQTADAVRGCIDAKYALSQELVDQGFDAAQFQIDWQTESSICPEGHTSISWIPALGRDKNKVIKVKFSVKDCRDCPSYLLCIMRREFLGTQLQCIVKYSIMRCNVPASA